MTQTTIAPPVPAPSARPPILSGIAARGVAAGVVAATVMALWFLMVDSSQGLPFRTPNFVAGSLLGLSDLHMSAGPIVLYTFIHYAIWIAVGTMVLLGLGIVMATSRTKPRDPPAA